MEAYIQTTFSVLAVINPFVCVAMLMEIDKGLDNKQKLLSVFKAMSTVLVILLVAAIAGKYILSAFAISMDAFKIIGGIILAFIGFKMLGSKSNNKSVYKENPNDLSELILFAASPGSIVMVITLAAIHNDKGIPLNAIIAVISAVIITVVIMVVVVFFGKNLKIKKEGLMSQFMGLIIAAMGLQFVLDGIKDFF